jgi:hypothetical protein
LYTSLVEAGIECFHSNLAAPDSNITVRRSKNTSIDCLVPGCLHQSPLNHAGGEIGAKGDIRELHDATGT